METTEVLLHSNPRVLEFEDLPVLNFGHVRNLTDDTGIIQHAIFNIPNRKEGYCIDDNSRALLLSVLACKDKENKTTLLPLLQVYLSFIHYMQTDNGEFKNFMSYTKIAHEERGSEDSFGRTIMALGFLVHEGPTNSLIKVGAELFSKAYRHIDKLVSLRGIANSIVGVCQYIKYNYPDDVKRDLVIKLADKMVKMYEENKENKWHWFEPVLTYDNAILPLALLNAYEITSDESYLTIALESMRFLESKVFHYGILSPVGNQGWLKRGSAAARFDQQGIDAMAMVLFYQQAFRVTRNKKYLSRMYQSYQWFLGTNDLGLPLYDAGTGGCADGLHSEGINLNQGAESTLAYWISHMVVAAAIKE
ncbi:MAG: group 1 glycosyl transferase [Segetibacter sp.]|nr:group 1 glycosyl transferase [Segetibacter sp.]